LKIKVNLVIFKLLHGINISNQDIIYYAYMPVRYSIICVWKLDRPL